MAKHLGTAVRIILVGLIATVFAASVSAQDHRQNVLDAAKSIENNTNTKEDLKAQYDALTWLTETEDVALIACGGTFGTFLDKKNKNSSTMTGAYMIGMGAFKLSGNTNANDENATQLAGLLLALKAYEYAVQEKPKTKNDKIDALIAKRDAGELAAMVNGFDCGKK